MWLLRGQCGLLDLPHRIKKWHFTPSPPEENPASMSSEHAPVRQWRTPDCSSRNSHLSSRQAAFFAGHTTLSGWTPFNCYQVGFCWKRQPILGHIIFPVAGLSVTKLTMEKLYRSLGRKTNDPNPWAKDTFCQLGNCSNNSLLATCKWQIRSVRPNHQTT